MKSAHLCMHVIILSLNYRYKETSKGIFIHVFVKVKVNSYNRLSIFVHTLIYSETKSLFSTVYSQSLLFILYCLRVFFFGKLCCTGMV